MTIDLMQAFAVDEVMALAASADALIERNRPGVMERLGKLGLTAENPAEQYDKSDAGSRPAATAARLPLEFNRAAHPKIQLLMGFQFKF